MNARGRTARRCAAAVLVAGSMAATRLEANPIALPGFPLKVDGSIRQPPTLADVDGDGILDLVVVHDMKVSVLSSEVKILPGWPVDLTALTRHPNITVLGPPAVADMDGDGKPEIALSLSYGIDADGAIVVLKGDGHLLWLLPVPSGLGAGCSMADLTGKHVSDVVVGTRGGQLLALDASGKPVPGFPARLGAAATSPAAFGALARGQKPVLAIGANDGKVYVISSTGQYVPGFPLVTHFAVSGQPAFGDVDDDGQGDLVVASQDFSVYAVKADGTPIPGFPVTTNYRIYGGPALGDLDHDGKLDIVVASTDGKIYAWNNKGELFPSFPVTAGPKLDREASVLLADSSRIGKDNIFITSADGQIYAFDGTGASLDGFPIGSGATSIAIGDVIADESEELVFGTIGLVQGYRLERKGSLPQAPLSWAATGHDSARSGHFGPNPPRYRNAALAPTEPKPGESLKLTYEYYSLDAAPEPATRIRWKLNGQPAAALDGQREIPAARLKRGDEYQALIQSPGDYKLYKDGPGATVVASNAVKITDTPPTTPLFAFEQVAVGDGVQIRVKITKPSTDADGDRITYRYRWERLGRVGSTTATMDGSQIHKGERWRVYVTPTDGEREGVPGQADYSIANSPPTAPLIALAPAQPTTEDDIKVNITKPAIDPDGDKVTYFYGFSVNSELLPLLPERGYLPKGIAKHGDVVRAEVWANDGLSDGPHVTTEIHVVNAAPKAPKVGIAPATPHTRDELSAGLVTPAKDPESDPVSYKIKWTKNGQPYGTPGLLVVPQADVKKGQHFTVEFTPSDGTLEGPSGTAEVSVGNLPPTAPRLKVSNATPTVGEASAVDITEDSVDPDGDAIKYEFAWTIDGKPAFADQADAVSSRAAAKKAKGTKRDVEVASAKGPIQVTGKTALKPGEFHKNQRYLVQVTAIDSDGARSPAGTAEIMTRNTPPGAPEVTLDPPEPTIETGLKVKIGTPATDSDSDPIIYHYKWYRDGVQAKDIGDRSAMQPGEVKHGEQWRVVVTAFDGEVDGAPVEAIARVSNTAPVAPVIAVGPAHPTVLTGLICNIKEYPTDADNDSIDLLYRWFRDGEPFALPTSAKTVPGGAVRAGQTWRCDATATDGTAQSKTVSATAVVEQAEPSQPTIEIAPRLPVAGDSLRCAISVPGVDPDGDRVKYVFRWVPPAGVTLPALSDPAQLPPGFVKKGQKWKCSGFATDAHLASALAVAETQIINTRPQAPEVEVDPPQPTAGIDLSCKSFKDGYDADGDPLNYAYTWYRNGMAQSFAPTSPEVPARLVKSGDRWWCSVVVNDGLDSSPAAHSVEVTVGAHR